MTDFAESLAALSRGESTLQSVLQRIPAMVDAAGDGGSLLATVQDPRWDALLEPRDRLQIEQRILEAETSARLRRPGAPPAGAGARTIATAAAAAEVGPGLDDDDRTRFVAPERELGVGDVIKDRFELVEELGQGGMGKVFKALDRRKVEVRDRDPHVAIKLLSRAFRRHEISAIALAREGKKAQSLNHPNIVRVNDVDRDGAVVFMSMEYLSGRSLDRMIKEPGFSGLPIDRVLEIVGPAAAALAYAHENDIVHSDFKPSNVFVTAQGKVKVIDFGIARAVKRSDAGEGDQTIYDPSALGALTLPYASPEQIAGLEPDRRDDVYALACVTYELLTGRHPFGRVSSAEASARKLQPDPVPGLDRLRWAAMQRGLAFDRAQRTPSVEAFVDGLRAPSAPSRPRWPVPVAAALALAIAGGVGWYLTQSTSDPAPALVSPPPSTTTTTTTTPAAPASPTEPAAVARPEEAAQAVPEAAPAPPPPVAPQIAALPPPPPAPPAAADLVPMLRAVPCSVLDAAVDPTGLVALDGHALADGSLAALEGRLRTVPGVTDVRADVRPLQHFHCPPLDVVAPFVRANVARRMGLGVAPAKPLFVTGDKLRVTVTGPSSASYVYVDFFDSGGDVLHLLPRPAQKANTLAAGTSLRLGDGGRSGDWTVQKPYGQDLFVVIASPVPLWQGARDDVESAATYLPALRRALDRVEAAHGEDRIAATFAVVTTKPRP